MNKREYCESRESIAYYSGYCVSGAWGGGKAFHRCKIYYPANGKDSAFFRVHGYKIPLDECIRMGV